jgi:hypothetical protein
MSTWDRTEDADEMDKGVHKHSPTGPHPDLDSEQTFFPSTMALISPLTNFPMQQGNRNHSQHNPQQLSSFHTLLTQSQVQQASDQARARFITQRKAQQGLLRLLMMQHQRLLHLRLVHPRRHQTASTIRQKASGTVTACRRYPP